MLDQLNCVDFIGELHEYMSQLPAETARALEHLTNLVDGGHYFHVISGFRHTVQNLVGKSFSFLFSLFCRSTSLGLKIPLNGERWERDLSIR